MTPVDTTAQWREDWQLSSVVNYIIVTDPTRQGRPFPNSHDATLPRTSLPSPPFPPFTEAYPRKNFWN